MLHSSVGPTQSRAFWQGVAEQRGRIVSSFAATLVLRCSHERLRQLIQDGDIEAWAYQANTDDSPQHSVVSIPSLVRFGIRAGRFELTQADELKGLNISPEEFAMLWEDVFGIDREQESESVRDRYKTSVGRY